jgi:valyl-tRNA synthetase
MPAELSKAYDPSQIETRWAEYWVREKLFHVDTPAAGGDSAAQPVFTLLIPPPNVTGRLHMGHMLNQTEMDIIIRWQRMCGHRTLWLPGTDHAGIATQMMVERQLAAEGKSRRDLGREAFVERVWQWREEYGGAILEQMRRLGVSVDWGREYFTMDENLSRAVREAFIRLYEDGLIYRGDYIVNWCPRCSTAISDLEVSHEDTPAKLYEIKYPVVTPQQAEERLAGDPVGTAGFITVATTRPETMLGDTAVAVNPRDPRYTHLHGKTVLLPLMEREIPIILDELAQPEFGTGAVKVTPAHDPNDFQAGLRHNLPQLTVMDESAHMNDQAGAYRGLDRFAARARVLQDLEARGLLAGIKDHTIPLGKCFRCGTIIEPRLSTQWFVAVNRPPRDGGPSLAEKAIAVARNGEIRFVPENYQQIYLNWMENIHDWCISRQLWWGHRIPAWHCLDCREVMVPRETPTACSKCGSSRLEQDPDVLDTWFSSGLLPMSALGWPEKTRDLEVFYPTSLLITGFDILFFWVARMIMLGCHFLAEHRQDAAVKLASGDGKRQDDSVPFRNVYIHALVRDAERQKMSKVKGNVIDPINVIEKYGTDATRFTLAAMASPGTDIAYNESRTEGYRAFANKIWNAARFMFMNLDRAGEVAAGAVDTYRERALSLEDRWILSRINRVAQQMNAALTEYRFNEAANVIYTFFWGEFCDWYIELLKPRLMGSETVLAKAERDFALHLLESVFETALRLLSPIMPFITDELWQAIYRGNAPRPSIALAEYPRGDPQLIDHEVEIRMAILQDLIVTVRNLRAELKIEPKLRIPIEVHAEDEIRRLVQGNLEAVLRLAGVEQVEFVSQSLAQQANSRSGARFDVRVLYERPVDVTAERERLQKELAKLDKEAENGDRQLANEKFLAKAPLAVVEGLRQRREEVRTLQAKARAALEGLHGAVMPREI